MKVVDCVWEQKNIGKKTVEIGIEETDKFDEAILRHYICNYEYVVIKVPMNIPTFNIGLTSMGFGCMELQINMSLAFEEFDFPQVQQFYNDTSFKVIKRSEDLQSVLSRIEPGMFSTDRVSVDPMFGESIGCRRYLNWITTEYKKRESSLVAIYYKDCQVGFMLVKIEGDRIKLLLNGLYKTYQGKGLGILTPASPFMYVLKNKLPIVKELTSISSNNIPVVKLYDRLHFHIDSQTYVFVKHNV